MECGILCVQKNLQNMLSLYYKGHYRKLNRRSFRNYEGGCVNCTGIGCECYEDLFLCKLSYQEYI